MIEQDVTRGKNQSFVLPLAAFSTSNTGRENRHACLEEAFNQLAIHDMESWSSNETAGNTGVALQGLAKYCLNVFVAYN